MITPVRPSARYTVRKDPVTRILHSSLHLHGVFPNFYVHLPDMESFVYRLAASLDKALNLSLY